LKEGAATSELNVLFCFIVASDLYWPKKKGCAIGVKASLKFLAFYKWSYEDKNVIPYKI